MDGFHNTFFDVIFHIRVDFIKSEKAVSKSDSSLKSFEICCVASFEALNPVLDFLEVCHCDSRHHEALCLNMNVLLHQMAHSQMEASPSSFVWLMKSQDCFRNCSTNSSQSFSITLRDSVNATEVLLPIKAKLSSPSLLSLFVNNINKMRTKRLQMRYLAE